MANSSQIEECFNIFDKAKKGYLERDQVGTALRALGKNPTEKELNALLDEAKTKQFDLAAFKVLYSNKKLRSPQDQDKEMRDAFKALDKENNGRVMETELRQILGNLGDALTSQEVNSLMREVKVDATGGIDYNEFIDMLVNAYPVGDRL